MEKSKRFLDIGILQAFGILCVFLGHALRIYQNGGWYFHKATPNLFCDIVDKFIYSFHMPLFVFLSGFLFYLNKDKITSVFAYILKRAKRLIVPFYLVGFLYVLPMICFINPLDKSAGFYYLNFLTMDYTWHLWFLPMLFLITIFFALYYFKFSKLNRYILLILLITASLLKIKGIPSCFAMIPKLAIYFYMGCVFVEFKDFVKIKLSKFLPLIFILMLGVESLLYLYPRYSILGLLSAGFAILFFYILAQKFSEKGLGENKIISFLSVNLFTLYILHEPIMAMILKYCDWGAKYHPALTTSLLFVGTLAICVVGIFIINILKSRFVKS